MAYKLSLFDQTSATLHTQGEPSVRFGNQAKAEEGKYVALVADWVADQEFHYGLFDTTNSTFYLRDADGTVTSVRFGNQTKAQNGQYQALAGDWNGDGEYTVGLFDTTNGTFYLRDADGSVTSVRYGNLQKAQDGDYQALVGDWNGDGEYTVGLFDTTNGTFYLRAADGSVTSVRYGNLQKAQDGDYQVNGYTPTPDPDVPTYTLAEFVEKFSHGEEDRPEPGEYKINPDESYEIDLEVARFNHAWNNTNTILDEAANADELEIGELFSWNVVDTAEAILDAAGEQVIEDANEVSLAEGEAATVAQAEALLALPNFDDNYSILDTAANLVTENFTKQRIINDAESIKVDGTATVAQMDTLTGRYGEVAKYSIEDTWANIEPAAAAVLEGATAITLDTAVTVADAADVIAFAYDITFEIRDTAAAILAAEQATIDAADKVTVSEVETALSVEDYNTLMGRAELKEGVTYTLADTLENLDAAAEGVVSGAASYELTDALNTFEGLTVANALSTDAKGILDGADNALDYDYTLADTLTALFDAGAEVRELADSYELDEEEGAFEGLTVANALSTEKQAVLEGADNAANYDYTLADTLANLLAAAEGVVAAADSYALTDTTAYENLAVADILSTEQFNMLDGASNRADIIYSISSRANRIFDGDEVKEELRDLLAHPDAITITDGVTRAQRADLNSINGDVVYEGGIIDGVFVLTTGVDEFTPTATDPANRTTDGADEFQADYDHSADRHTLGALDVIDGGLGQDTLKITSDTGAAYEMAQATISNVQTITIRGDDDVTADVSGSNITGLETLNSTLTAGNLMLTAAETTDVNTSGTKGTITVLGGKDISVTDATAAKEIIVGSAANKTDDPAGTVNITDTDISGENPISVYGGTDVNIMATADVSDVDPTGNITVGHATQGTASGDVTITQNYNSDGSAVLDATGVVTTVTGGKNVEVTINANSNAAKFDSNANIQLAKIEVIADDETESVTLTQNANITRVTRDAEAEVKATQEVTFKALASGESVTVNGLVFTAAKNLTAEEVAQAFSELTVDDRQDAGGKVANGIYTDLFDEVSGWTSGVADGAKVVFTAPAWDSAAINVASSAGATSLPTLAPIVAGTNAVGEATSDNNVEFNNDPLTVNDNAEKSIKSITLDGYAGATLGGTSSLDALETLSLTNSVGATLLTTTKTALDLTVDEITGAGTVSLDEDGATITDLNLTATGTASDFELTAAAVENLNIMAAPNLDLTGSTLGTSLETVEITGTGAVTLPDISGHVGLNSFDASGNDGGVTATVDANSAGLGDIEEYVFSQGADDVTLNDDTIDIDVSLGGGNDKLTLNSFTTDGNVTDLTATLDGGTGENTLAIGSQDAAARSVGTDFQGKFTNFQKLELGEADADRTVNMANMNNISHVITNGTVGPQIAVYTIDLTGIALDTDDTFSIDGALAHTAAADGEDLDDVAAGIDGGTVAFGGVTYDIDATDPTAVTLTAQTYAAVTDNIDLTVDDVSSNGVATPPDTNAAIAPTIEGVAGDPTNAANYAALTLENLADEGTVELNGSGQVVVNIDGADEVGSDDDTLNVVANNAGGFLDVNDVENINIDAAAGTSQFSLRADSVESLIITGSGDLDLTDGAGASTIVNAGNSLTLIDASEMTGGLTYTANVAELVVQGGHGEDNLTAAASDVKLYGGDGNDTLTVNASANRVNLWGGDGEDTFIIAGASSSSSTYAIIRDINSGDTIQMTGSTAFKAAEVTLSEGATVTTQALADEAISNLNRWEMGWFQHDGNTFIVMDAGDNAAFEDGTDMIVMLSGVHDLSTASFNTTDLGGNGGTLEIA